MGDYYLSSMTGGCAWHASSGPRPAPPGESPLIEAIEARERTDSGAEYARVSGPARPGRGALPSRSTAWSQPDGGGRLGAEFGEGFSFAGSAKQGRAEPPHFAGAGPPPRFAGEAGPGDDTFDAKIARLMSLPHRAARQPDPSKSVSATALYSDYSTQAMTSAEALRHEAYVNPSEGSMTGGVRPAAPPRDPPASSPGFSFREFAPEKGRRRSDYV